MRVTNKMLSNNYLRDMNTNLQNMQTIQKQMSSGKKFSKPSDDPFNVARSMQLNSQINANTQYNKNTTNVINWQDTTDTALGQLGNVFQSIREKLVSAGNAAYGSDERESIKNELNEQVGQIAQVLNTSFDGEYIFGGTQGTYKPVGVKQVYTFPQEVNKSNSSGGNASLSGSYNGDKNLSYVIRVKDLTAGSEQIEVSTDGGENFGSGISISSGVFDIGNGMKININFNENTKAGDKYSFSMVEGKELMFTSKDGNELNIDPLEVSVSSVDEWSLNKTITFNVNGTSNSYTVGLGDLGQNLTKEELVKALNDSINSFKPAGSEDTPLKGKINISLTDDGKIKFTSLTDDTITMESSDISDLASVSNKEITSYQVENLSGNRKTEISQGVTINYNVTAKELLSFSADNEDYDVREILSDIISHLDSQDAADTSKLTNEDLSKLDKVMSNLLKTRSEVGAKQNRMESAQDQNQQTNLDLTEILSNTEDIDITEKTMEYATMQTVYLAALQTSAKVLQPTLMDYM